MLIKIFQVRIVYHLHNKGITNNQTKFLYNILYKFVFNNTQVILLSNKLYFDVKKYVPKDRVYFCSNGIPKIISNISLKKPHSNTIQILFLSNLINSKGVYVLLDACKILMNKNINFCCTYVGAVGDVTEQDFLNKINDYGLSDFVVYAGKMYGVQKEKILNNSDIFVLPTLDDCFPLVLLEAMQFNLSIISTFEGAIPDIIEDNKTGYLVQKNDVKNLAIKIELLIKNPQLRKKMSNAAYEKFNECYTLKKFEKNIKNILINI